MNKNISLQLMSTLLFIALMFSVGCKTEEEKSLPKNNDAMVGYTQDFANAQTDFFNQEKTKKDSHPSE